MHFMMLHVCVWSDSVIVSVRQSDGERIDIFILGLRAALVSGLILVRSGPDSASAADSVHSG